MAATIVSGRPSGSMGVAKASDPGSTVGEKTQSAAVSGAGLAAASARLAASLSSRSTSLWIASMSFSDRTPCA
jgi:hypothetical protein